MSHSFLYVYKRVDVPHNPGILMDSDTMMIKQHNILGPSIFTGMEPAFASSQEKLKQLGIIRITTTGLKNQSLCSDTLWPAEVPPSVFPSSGCNFIPFVHLMTGFPYVSIHSMTLWPWFPCSYFHPVIGRVPCSTSRAGCRGSEPWKLWGSREPEKKCWSLTRLGNVGLSENGGYPKVDILIW